METGKIEKKEMKEGIGQSGKPYKMYIYTINGQKYSTFSDDELKVGESIDFSFEQNDKYRNLKAFSRKAADPEFKIQVEKVEDYSPATNIQSIGSLKVKIIEARDFVTFERALNQFGSEHNVKFTQTHVNVVQSGGQWEQVYTAIIFYGN